MALIQTSTGRWELRGSLVAQRFDNLEGFYLTGCTSLSFGRERCANPEEAISSGVWAFNAINDEELREVPNALLRLASYLGTFRYINFKSYQMNYTIAVEHH